MTQLSKPVVRFAFQTSLKYSKRALPISSDQPVGSTAVIVPNRWPSTSWLKTNVKKSSAPPKKKRTCISHFKVWLPRQILIGHVISQQKTCPKLSHYKYRINSTKCPGVYLTPEACLSSLFMKQWFSSLIFTDINRSVNLQLIIRVMSTSGVYLKFHLGAPAFIRSPAFNRVNSVRLSFWSTLVLSTVCLMNCSFGKQKKVLFSFMIK